MVGKRIRPCPPPELTLGLPLYFPDSLPHHPRLATAVPCAMPPTAESPRQCACVLQRQAPTSTRPWVGYRLRRLCSAEERKARGPRAQRASCSVSLRLSERSERSSRSEFRNGVTRLSTAGNRRLQGDGAASEAADGGPPAAHARPQTKLSTTARSSGRYAPVADTGLRCDGSRTGLIHLLAMSYELAYALDSVTSSRRTSTAELRGTTGCPRASRCVLVKAAPNSRISDE